MPHSVTGVRDLVLSYGPLGPFVSIILMILHSLIPFPSEVVTFANGMIYGPLWGILLSWVGAMLGAYLAFGIARWGGRPLAARFGAGRHLDRFDGWVARYGVGALLLLRLMPVVSFNLINYAAGLTQVSWWTFTWTTALGILPMTALVVLAGDQLGRGSTLGLWIASGLVLVGGVVWLWKRKRQ